jgi:RimK family alpha-L-glutamate ligase
MRGSGFQVEFKNLPADNSRHLEERNDMRIGVLGSADSWYTNDLMRAAGLEMSIEPAAFSQVSVCIGGNAGVRVDSEPTALHDLDAVIVRTMPPGSLEQVVFRMDALATLEEQGVVVLNRPKAIEAAVDKFLTTARLHRQGIATPQTVACQDFESAMNAFESFGGDIVLKPLFGGEGRGIMRLDDSALAHRCFKTLGQLDAVFYIQPFIEHDSDIRLLRIGEQVFGMRRRNALDWRTNVSQGGRAEPLRVDSQLERLAMESSDAVGAEIAGVDVIVDNSGRQLVLEVNAVPGWRALQRVVEIDVAAAILDFAASRVGKAALETD